MFKKKVKILIGALIISTMGGTIHSSAYSLYNLEGERSYSQNALRKKEAGAANVWINSFNRTIEQVKYRFAVVKNDPNYTFVSDSPVEYRGRTNFNIPYASGKGIVNNDYRLRGCYVSGSARDVTTTGGWTA